MKICICIFAFVLISASLTAQTINSWHDNSLSKKEIKQGWQMLFDGQTLNGWKGYNSDKMFSCWSVANGELVCQGEGGSVTAGDIITVANFDNFELCLEWSISKAGNSGIFYHVLEGGKYHAAYETAPEYQLIDDLGWPDKLEEWQKTGADYAMTNTTKDKKLMPVGEWNHSRIIYNKGHVEYWLNGMKVVEFQAYSPEWEKLRSSGKWKEYPDYAISKTGHIGLQNHGSGVKFRNIKARKL
ncbi:MAG: DUF1080 domain-containing protein [Bacteroidales bacterium]|nr:DUF1080 domain-containing protein [Bacteroidales bacterium]